jgi:hypothetical protein
MDVIVDTCILLADPFMRSNDFKDLFQHLRTTDCRLVILPIVFDEAVAKHEKELAGRYEKARNASRRLNVATLHPLAPPIGELNLTKEAHQFREFLKSARRIAEPLPLKLLSDYSKYRKIKILC